MFVSMLKSMYPKMTAREVMKLLARYKGIKASYGWVLDQIGSLEYHNLLDEFEMTDEEEKAAKADATKAIALITEDTARDIKQIVDDNKELAKSIKTRMMDQVDERLEIDPDKFTNDELIRGAKTFHEIENNTQQGNTFNFNNVDPNVINQLINQLEAVPHQANTGGAEDTGGA